MNIINFASDNSAGVHPSVLERIAAVNNGAVSSYGNDPYTAEAVRIFKRIFSTDAGIFFVLNGTGANTVALSAMTAPYSMILTAPLSHITEDECGSVQKATGCPVRFVRPDYGKIRPEHLEAFMSLKGDVHKSQPAAVSISQATERGECYTMAELAELSAYCRENNLLLHMDGARFTNALCFLDGEAATLASYADILCFGGTKNGLMAAEAVIVNNPVLLDRIPYFIKQELQLASKMRYISAQFLAYFDGDLWLNNAKHSNFMTAKLYEGIAKHPSVKILNVPQANMIFADMDNRLVNRLLEKYYFYVIEQRGTDSTVRLMTSWQTTVDEVNALIKDICG